MTRASPPPSPAPVRIPIPIPEPFLKGRLQPARSLPAVVDPWFRGHAEAWPSGWGMRRRLAGHAEAWLHPGGPSGAFRGTIRRHERRADLGTRTHPSLDGCSVFVTAVTSGRRPLFADPRLAMAVRDVFLRTAQELGVTLHAWVIMPDHVHLLLNPGERDLSWVMRLLKGRSARIVNGLRRARGPMWQRRFDDRVVSGPRALDAYVAYIHANPVNAGLADDIFEYPFSSARAYHQFDAPFPDGHPRPR